MSKEEKFYTSEDLTGYDLNDRLYSESEVEQINDLFSEFYELHSDFYNDNEEEAYADFFDAYSTMKIEDNTPPHYLQKSSGNPKAGRAVATVAGGAVGYGVGKLATRKDRAKKAILVKKVSSGTASKQDLKELSNINKRIALKEVGSTVAGAGAGLGLAAIASKYKRK